MLHIDRACHPGPDKSFFTPGQLSVEFVNVGGWLTYGDLALDSCAQFPAVAEHRLIPSRARSICHQLRKAGHQSVWVPACQDQVAGGHAGVGVVSLGGATVALPSCATSEFKEVFRLGRALRVTLSTGMGGVVRLFCSQWISGAEEDSEKLQLADKLVQAVLAEAQVVCVVQLLHIAGDLNADPAVIPCLGQGFVDLALAYSLGAGREPDATCKFRLDGCVGSRSDFFVGCSNGRFGQHAGLTLLTELPLLYLVLFRMLGMLKGRSLELCLLMWYLLFGMRLIGRMWMTSGQSGARMLRWVSLVHIAGPEAPLLLVVMPFGE